MADGEDAPLSRGGIVLALIAGLSGIATLIAALATPGASYTIAAAWLVCCALVVWVAPRFPGGGLFLGLGGGLAALVAVAFAESSLMPIVMTNLVAQVIVALAW